MSSNQQSAISDSGAETPAPTSLSKKIALTFVFFILLIFFTMVKLPQTKITSVVQGYMQAALDPYGIYISDHGREFSVWKGFQYRLIQPSFELPDQSRVELDEIVVSPKLLSLLTGKMGANIEITQAPSKTEFSRISIDGTIRGDLVNASVKIDNLDLAKFGIFAFAGSLKGNGTLSGDIQLEGHLADLPSMTGRIYLKLKKLRLDEQNLFGFQLPTMDISDGTIDATIEHSKLVMKQVQIGKGTDDLQLGVTGDITLNRNLNASALNLRTVLALSDKVKQSLALLDTLLGAGKQGDGRYVYKLTGTLGAPNPAPEPQK